MYRFCSLNRGSTHPICLDSVSRSKITLWLTIRLLDWVIAVIFSAITFMAVLDFVIEIRSSSGTRWIVTLSDIERSCLQQDYKSRPSLNFWCNTDIGDLDRVETDRKRDRQRCRILTIFSMAMSAALDTIVSGQSSIGESPLIWSIACLVE
jgi:hypothetical protein